MHKYRAGFRRRHFRDRWAAVSVQGSTDSQVELRQAAGAGLKLVLAGGLAGILNFLFNVVLARNGGAANYGEIGPLLAIITLVGLAASGVQYGIARMASISSRPPRTMLAPAFRVVLPWLACTVLLTVLAWPLGDFLRLSSPLLAVAAAAVASVGVAGAAVGGLLVGFRRFNVVAILAVGPAALRLAFGVLAGKGSTVVVTSLAASSLATGASFLGGLVFLLFFAGPPEPGKTADLRSTGQRAGHDSLTGALIASSLWATWTIPVLFARHSLPPRSAGDFAADQLVAGALIWGTAPIVTAFYPTIVRHRRRAAVVFGQAATSLVALSGGCLLTILGPLLLRHLYGSGFSQARSLLLALALSATVIASATFAAWAALAAGQHLGALMAALVLALGLELAWDGTVAHGVIALALGPVPAVLLPGAVYLILTISKQGSTPKVARLTSDPADTVLACHPPERRI